MVRQSASMKKDYRGKETGHHINQYVMPRLLEPMGLEPTTC